MKEYHQTLIRRLKLTGMTILLACIILFIFHTSEAPRWGGGYWEEWLVYHYHISPTWAKALVFWVRKSIHFVGYGIFGLLFWYEYICAQFKGAFWLGIGSALTIAGLDEYLQSRTTFRSGQPTDVVLDFLGILCFAALTKAVLHRRGRMSKYAGENRS